jgi:hypothetical protein
MNWSVTGVEKEAVFITLEDDKKVILSRHLQRRTSDPTLSTHK